MTHHDHDHDHDHHHHHHEHDHGHHHHDHGHGHRHESEGAMTEKEKLAKLLEHWESHNDDHADNFMKWSEKAAGMHLEDAARLLKQAAELTREISGKFNQAAKSLKSG